MDITTKYNHMTTAEPSSVITELAIPSIISMLVTHIYNTADTYFVSQISVSASGAVGISFAFMAILQALGFFFGHGSGNYISRRLGARDVAAARIMASTGFGFAFGAGCLVLLISQLCLSHLARALGATATIAPYAESYLRIICYGAPLIIPALVLNNQLRFQGSSAYGMVGIVSGAFLNIILDPLFIFVLGLGIQGAAISTVISQAVSLTLLIAMTRRDGNLSLHFANFRPSYALFTEIIKGGTPSMCRQSLECLGAIVLNLASGAYGDAAVAAMSIVGRVIFIPTAIMLGFGQGYQPLCGFSYGAQLYGRLRTGYRFALRVMIAIALTCTGLICFTAPAIISLFRGEIAVVSLGAAALRLQSITLPLSSFGIIANMTLQTVGWTREAVIVALARRGLFLIPLLGILPLFLGLNGVLYAQPLTDILSALLSFAVIRHFFHLLPQ